MIFYYYNYISIFIENLQKKVLKKFFLSLKIIIDK